MAVFPITGTHPNYSSTGSYKFIPQLWAGQTIVKWYDYCVLPQITNTMFEGSIKKQGDTVIIRTVPDITISDYAMGGRISYEQPVSAPVTLLIDKGKYWAVEMDDVLKVQQDIPMMNKWTTDAAQQLKISIETAFFADSAIYAGMTATENTGTTAGKSSASFNIGTTGSPVQITDANVLDYIIDCGTVLDEQNVPETGRWFVIPTWMAGLIKKSDLKDASLTGDSVSPLRNGRLGMIDRFTLYSSNLLNHSGTSYWHALFGVNDAITFATQLTETESLRSQDSFADRVRGLQVYGYKVINGDGYGALICYK